MTPKWKEILKVDIEDKNILDKVIFSVGRKNDEYLQCVANFEGKQIADIEISHKSEELTGFMMEIPVEERPDEMWSVGEKPSWIMINGKLLFGSGLMLYLSNIREEEGIPKFDNMVDNMEGVGSVNMIEVKPEWKGKGVATKLYEYAITQIPPEFKWLRGNLRTEEATAFWRSLGFQINDGSMLKKIRGENG